MLTRRTLLRTVLLSGPGVLLARTAGAQDASKVSGLIDLGHPVNDQHPLADGLLAWWLYLPGRAGGGTLWYDLTRNLPGTLTNMASPGTATSGWGRTTLRPGGWGEMHFDVTNDLVLAPATPALNNLTLKTVTAWIRKVSSGASNLGRIVDKRGSSGWCFLTDAADVASGMGYNQDWTTGGQWFTTGSSLPLLSTWYHVAVTYDASLTTNAPIFYVNGTVWATSTSTAATGSVTSDASSAVTVGNQSSGTRGFEGALDDIRIYNRILSAKQILAAYHNSRLGYPGLLRRMPLATSGVASAAAAAGRAKGRVF